MNAITRSKVTDVVRVARSRLERIVARAPVAAFLAFTFAYSWTAIGIVALTVENTSIVHELASVHGPLVGAAVTVRLLGEELRSWLGHVRNWRVGLRWYAVGVAIVVVATELDNLVALVLGADLVPAELPLVLYPVQFLFVLLFAGALEEFGWRGFAQVRLQRRHSALLTNGFIGVVWAAWHLPLFFVMDHAYDPATLGPYVVMQIATSIIYGWLYNGTGGGLFVVMVAHAASNMPSFLTVRGETPALVEAVPFNMLFYVGVAAAVVLYAGPETLTRDGSLPPIPSREGGSA